MARHHIGRERVEHRIGRDRREALGRAVERERLALAQIEQAGDLVDLGAGEHHRRDRAVAQSLARVERAGSGELGAQVGGGVEQHPVRAVGRYGYARLGAKLNPAVALPSEATDRATAIPLGIAPASRSTNHDGGQAPHAGAARSGRIRTRPAGIR